ncbi:MAG: GTPase domain-containing protein, partial [Planctomycetes bacterium]|nr:GTPase domain-containing protein [Planctomycetota bacterium]
MGETGEKGSPPDLKPLLQGLREFVEGARPFPALAARREAALSNLRALAVQEGNLQGSLLVLFLGGTGAGKSTLINAVAGKNVAEVSDVRPCTRAVTFYTHEGNDLAPLRSAIAGGDVLATHADEGLRRKILVDPPDFDSTVLENREALFRILAVSDLVVVLADREKYRNETLYRVLAPHQGRKRFLFVLNKTDALWDPRIRDDFRASLLAAGFGDPEILALSALAALRGDAGAAGDFPRLQAILREEIDRIRIREIKESNVLGLLGHVVDAIGSSLPRGAGAALEAWSRAGAEASRALAAVVRDEASAALFGDSSLPDAIADAQARGARGLFGAWLAGAARVRAWSRPVPGAGAASAPAQARRLAEDRMARADGARVAEAARARLRRRREALRSLGIEPGPEPERDADAWAASALASAREEASARIGAALRDAEEGRILRLRDLAYNLPPAALIAAVAAEAGIRLWKGEPAGVELAASGLVLLVALLAAEGWIAANGTRRRARRLVREIEERIEAQAQESAEAAFGAAEA